MPSNLLTCLDRLTKYIDNNISVDVAFLDFAKAFDKVPHQRLLKKIKSHGIDGKILKWIENWLTGREQSVCFKGVRSIWRRVVSGVPQGSVLGPSLFLIFVNDLDIGIEKWLLKFADDIKIIGKVQNSEDQSCFQSVLDTVEG